MADEFVARKGLISLDLVRPGNTSDTTTGNIRFDGTNLQGRMGSSWVNLGAFETGTAFPSSPVDGQPFWHETDEVFYIYSSTATSWIDVSSTPTPTALSKQNETVDGGVATGDPVYFDGSSWKKSTGSTDRPTAMASSVSGEIVFCGIIGGLSGLSAGQLYYLATAGGLTTDSSETGIFIGLGLSGQQLLLDIDSGSGGGTSTKQTITQAGITVGKAVLHDGLEAQADSAANAEAIGVVESVSGSDGVVVTSGKISLASGVWPDSAVAGDVLYLDPDTAGALTTTAPTTNGDISKPMVICTSTTEGVVVNYRGSIVSSDLFVQAPLFQIQQRAASGVGGGTNTADAWTTRPLTDNVINQITGASRSGNVITLPTGEYYVQASSTFYRTDQCTTRFRNTSDGTTVAKGTSELSGNAALYASANSDLSGRFTVSGSSKTFELQYYTNTSFSDGLGTNSSSTGEEEVYVDLKIWKVGN